MRIRMEENSFLERDVYIIVKRCSQMKKERVEINAEILDNKNKMR